MTFIATAIHIHDRDRVENEIKELMDGIDPHLAKPGEVWEFTNYTREPGLYILEVQEPERDAHIIGRVTMPDGSVLPSNSTNILHRQWRRISARMNCAVCNANVDEVDYLCDHCRKDIYG